MFTKLKGLIDSIAEVLTIYAVSVLLFVVSIGFIEHWSVLDSIWWGIVTITTTGYGDIAPKSDIGRILAAILMMLSWLFNVILAGLVAAKLIVNSDAWTHSEQEEVKTLLRNLNRKMDQQEIHVSEA